MKKSVDETETVRKVKRIGAKTKEEIQLFRDNKDYKDDVFVAVNGVAVQIKRGEKVSIDNKYAAVLHRQEAQDLRTAEMMSQKQDQFFAESANRNI